MNRTLYELTAEYKQLLQHLEDVEGELTEEVESIYEINKDNFRDKSENYAKIIQSLENDIISAEAEIERINKFIESKTKIQKRLKADLLEAIKLYGQKDLKKDIWRFEAGTYKFGTRSSSSVIIEDESLIPDEYIRYNTTLKLTSEDKEKIITAFEHVGLNVEFSKDYPKKTIAEAINNNGSVPGADLVTNYSLTIK